MSIHTPEELAAMRESGHIVRLMLEAMKTAARSGVTTEQLDEIGGDLMRQNGAVSGPTTVYQFPGVSCISVNDEIVHGIPSNRRLRNGDLLKLDVTISKDGFMADAAETVIVGSARHRIRHRQPPRRLRSARLHRRHGGCPRRPSRARHRPRRRKR